MTRNDAIPDSFRIEEAEVHTFCAHAGEEEGKFPLNKVMPGPIAQIFGSKTVVGKTQEKRIWRRVAENLTKEQCVELTKGHRKQSANDSYWYKICSMHTDW